MALPPSITRKLLQATCDKTSLNRQVLRYHRCFKEVLKILDCPQKHKKK